MKLLIAIPSNRDWKAAFGNSLAALAIYLTKQQFDFDIYSLNRVSCLAQARQRTIDDAIDGSYTHVLFIDDDMGFEPQAFEILSGRNVDFVGANCVKRDGSGTPTTTNFNSQRVYSTGRVGIEEVSNVGFGFTLIKMSIFKNIPCPYFEVRWAENASGESVLISEDEFFCIQLRKHNIHLFVDHDAARHVTHWGDVPFQEKF